MRMIEGYLGADVFRNGVNAYLEEHAYGNATSADFWTTMTRVSGKPIDRIQPPDRALSLVFCGPDRRTLFITARHSVYLRR